MSRSSKLRQILEAIAGKVSALAFTWPETNEFVPVLVKKLPRSQAGIDPMPGAYVYRSDSPEDYKAMAFGGNSSLTYLIYVVIVAPGDQDLESNIDIYDMWRDQIISEFKPPNLPTDPPLLEGVSGVWDIDVQPDVWLPRQQININYDYLGLGILVSVTKTD